MLRKKIIRSKIWESPAESICDFHFILGTASGGNQYNNRSVYPVFYDKLSDCRRYVADSGGGGRSCPDAEYDDASSGREKICFCLYRSPWLVYDFYQNRCFTGSDSGSVRTGMAGNHTHDFLYDKRSTGDCSHLFS